MGAGDGVLADLAGLFSFPSCVLFSSSLGTPGQGASRPGTLSTPHTHRALMGQSRAGRTRLGPTELQHGRHPSPAPRTRAPPNTAGRPQFPRRPGAGRPA